ncbi:MAG TPA: asparagine synthase-related protein [Gemmataceae bacterium]|nr:asparagine synthase-related protein [Gemmataceae bacterium]
MIAGLVDWGRSADCGASLARMLSGGAWERRQGEGIALAASRPGATGPAAAGGQSWAVADGLLYNRAELTSALGLTEGERQGWGDAALLLAGYERWGSDVVDHVSGDVAFAVWDGARNTLFAATDPFGLRPLCYAAGESQFAFGSRVGQLERLAWVGTDVNERTVVSLLTDVWDDAGATFVRGVRQLPPGYSLTATAGHARLRRYWSPRRWPRPECRSEREVLERFEDLVRRAVRVRLDAPGRLGILMSGGFDSTAVSGVAADLWLREGRPPRRRVPLVISGRFGDLPCDESRYIDAALSRLPFESRGVAVLDRGLSPDAILEDVRRHEAPFVSRQRPLCEEFARVARGAGVATLMTGLGGDELTTDYGYSADLLRTGRLARCYRSAACASRGDGVSLARVLVEIVREACPEAVKRPYRALRRLLGRRRPPAPGWLSPEAAAVAATPDRPGPQPCPDLPSRTAEFAWRVASDPYNHWSNRWWVTEFAASGIRVCCPLLDRRLFEFVLGVPARLRPCCDGVARFKLLISRGLRRYLPDELHGRGDKVFFESYNNLVFEQTSAALRRYLFGGAEWLAERFVPRARAEALFEAAGPAAAGADALARSQQIEPLWRVAGLELWLRARRADRVSSSPQQPVEGSADERCTSNAPRR